MKSYKNFTFVRCPLCLGYHLEMKMKLSSAVVRRVACILFFPLLWSCCCSSNTEQIQQKQKLHSQPSMNKNIVVVGWLLLFFPLFLQFFRMQCTFYFCGNSVQFCTIPYPRHDDDLRSMKCATNAKELLERMHYAHIFIFNLYYYDYFIFCSYMRTRGLGNGTVWRLFIGC